MAVSHPLHNSVGAHPVTLHLFSVRVYDQFMSVVCPAVSESSQHSSISCPVTGAVVTHPAVTHPLHISVATIPGTLDLFCWWICDQDVSVTHPAVSESFQHTSVSALASEVLHLSRILSRTALQLWIVKTSIESPILRRRRIAAAEEGSAVDHEG